MKRFVSPLLFSGLSALLFLSCFRSALASSETYAAAIVASVFIDDRHSASPPATPDSSTASKVTATGQAHADAFNTGKLGASAAAVGGTTTLSIARITDTLYLNLPQAIPTADGMVLHLQLHGSMGANWNAPYTNAYSALVVSVYNQPGGILANGCLYLQNPGLNAPPLCDGTWPNDFLEPLNTPYYPQIGSAGQGFSFNAPFYLIMKGITPAAFNGMELTIDLSAKVLGPGSASFLNTLEFDRDHPIQLYASGTQSIIPLPPGSTYHSGSGMGVSQTPVIVVPPAATLDVDASVTASKYDALTDGLIAIRYLFGLTGTSLTAGALGGTATRTDPAVIKIYLDGIRTSIDIDGNGTADALTDGLLILRYLFGLRGGSLIAGAVDPVGTRQSATDIETYIQTLMP